MKSENTGMVQADCTAGTFPISKSTTSRKSWATFTTAEKIIISIPQ